MALSWNRQPYGKPITSKPAPCSSQRPRVARLRHRLAAGVWIADGIAGTAARPMRTRQTSGPVST